MKQLLLTLPAAALLANGVLAGGTPEQFKAYDTDGNGKMTREEYLAYQRGWFKKYDRNNDGALTRDEFDNAAFEDADGDKDGKITAAENVAWRGEQFKMLDKNTDGSVTLEEFTAADQATAAGADRTAP